jgi:tRNA (cmo5U34)-methyltransferase
MSVDWRDPAIADSWDRRGGERLPTRAEQVDIACSVLEEAGAGWILDLDSGSGLVAELLLDRIADARIVCADVSERMLELARERLRRFGDRVELVRVDLESAGARLPERPYVGAIAVQALHNVEPLAQVAAIRLLAAALPHGALFVLVDKFSIPERLYSLYVPVWKRLEQLTGELPETEEFSEHLALLAADADKPVPLARQLRWLRDAGFDAALVHLHGNRAVVAARRL